MPGLQSGDKIRSLTASALAYQATVVIVAQFGEPKNSSGRLHLCGPTSLMERRNVQISTFSARMQRRTAATATATAVS